MFEIRNRDFFLFLSHFIILFIGLMDFIFGEDMDTVQMLPKCPIPP